jgi:hypothetical protein
MNSYMESSLGKDGSNGTRVTTLYDLMEEINAQQISLQKDPGSYSIQEPKGNGRFSPVAEKVFLMFESGQIRFKNLQDVKRKYAGWLF